MVGARTAGKEAVGLVEEDLVEACRLAYLLTTLGQLSEAELIEERLARLETLVNDKET